MGAYSTNADDYQPGGQFDPDAPDLAPGEAERRRVERDRLASEDQGKTDRD